MFTSRSSAVVGVLSQAWIPVCLLLCGCEKSDRITTYNIPKHEALQSPEFLAGLEQRHPKPRRMIAVVIPREDWLWFFKMEGDVEPVVARANEVREFLKSVSFSNPDRPEWTVPPNWQQLPGNEMRYATLLLDGEPHLELSVTKLPAQRAAISEQVVANINRWRNQLSLPPIDENELSAYTEKLTLNDSIAFWSNMVGRGVPKQAAMPRAPRQVAQNDDAGKPAIPEYDQPEGWVKQPPGKFAVIVLEASDETSKVGITVTPARGSRLDNVNRWRGQLGLNPLTEKELDTSAKKVTVGKQTGEQFEMSNETKMIFGVIVEVQGQTWFVKLDGDPKLAERERPRFEAFLKSLRWK